MKQKDTVRKSATLGIIELISNTAQCIAGWEELGQRGIGQVLYTAFLKRFRWKIAFERKTCDRYQYHFTETKLLMKYIVEPQHHLQFESDLYHFQLERGALNSKRSTSISNWIHPHSNLYFNKNPKKPSWTWNTGCCGYYCTVWLVIKFGTIIIGSVII